MAADLHAPVLAWYAEHQRMLPWRGDDRTPWGVLVSEIMLQQTPVARVLPVWQAWMRRWPTPADLSAASPADVIRAWGRLGYPRRALRLHEAATAIVRQHHGAVPDTIDQLRALPGIGAYTAAAVAVFAYGRRHPVLDTNVRRVLARAVSGRERAPAGLTRREMELAESMLPADDSAAATWSVAVMELGALVCRARTPDCAACPIAASCAWLRAGRPENGGPARPGQAWHGTDRQARGRLMATFRAATGPLSRDQLSTVWEEPVQRERALTSLLADGLLERRRDGTIGLPDEPRHHSSRTS